MIRMLACWWRSTLQARRVARQARDAATRQAEMEQRFADFEQQTKFAASRLAQQGIAKRAAKLADTTAALHRAIDAGAIVPLDQPLPAERLAAAMKGLGIKRVRQHG